MLKPNHVKSQFTPRSNSIAGGPTCPEMQPFCPNDGTSYDFFLSGTEATTTCPGCDFGCLSTHPGEQWLYIEIASPGDVQFTTSSTSDHDYAVWGPYASKAAAIAGCSTLPAPTDCSFHPQALETINV